MKYNFQVSQKPTVSEKECNSCRHAGIPFEVLMGKYLLYTLNNIPANYSHQTLMESMETPELSLSLLENVIALILYTCSFFILSQQLWASAKGLKLISPCYSLVQTDHYKHEYCDGRSACSLTKHHSFCCWTYTSKVFVIMV